MTISVSPNSDAIFTALGSFLAVVLPPSVAIRQGQLNRIAEPSATDFCVMWPLRAPRLATNIDDYLDAVFTGSIASTIMTIAAVNPEFSGKIAVGSSIFGVGVATDTIVTALGTGTGGVGTYTVAPLQSVGSGMLAAGIQSLMQETEVVLQVDVHGPASWNNAQIVSTTFCDQFAVSQFASLGSAITPLYADDPRQVPFENENQQIEQRWIVEVHMQCDAAAIIPQQFAQALRAGLINVDVSYPP